MKTHRLSRKAGEKDNPEFVDQVDAMWRTVRQGIVRDPNAEVAVEFVAVEGGATMTVTTKAAPKKAPAPAPAPSAKPAP